MRVSCRTRECCSIIPSVGCKFSPIGMVMYADVIDNVIRAGGVCPSHRRSGRPRRMAVLDTSPSPGEGVVKLDRTGAPEVAVAAAQPSSAKRPRAVPEKATAAPAAPRCRVGRAAGTDSMRPACCGEGGYDSRGAREAGCLCYGFGHNGNMRARYESDPPDAKGAACPSGMHFVLADVMSPSPSNHHAP